MSTNRNPIFVNAAGNIQVFDGEDTLRWDFTSGTGNPMELLVSSSVYFTFDRNGVFTIESDIKWNADTGGDIGEQYDYRPDNINAASKVAVGAASGVGDGAKLELNTLTLGHGNVNKYIDAEQGLGNTPAIRYNAVNTRWEFSDDGISYTSFNAGFGTTDWDTLYAADKTLLINSTVLTFTHTNTSGVGFAITRNLAAANTDSPVMVVEQQNAGDDQPGLAVAQVATAASALDIYEGTQAAGTIRYGFGATGKLTITTNSALADSALHLLQNDVDDSFITFEGTSGAGASVNISTDNGATADMIQVVVDGGVANTRWIPAYSSTTLPAANTWDSIYLTDKHLAINAAVLQFEQTATTGRGFEVFRNLASASTDAPIMVMEQQHAGDDQPPLAIGQLASAADALQIFDGSVASGTMRFQFEPQGRLNIITNAALGSEAFRIEQNDDNVAFMEFKGTAAAGSGKNISTDNAPTADMLRVDVDDGGGAATRWVPAYNSSTLPAVPTWDSIYSGDKTLDINSTVLTFDQSSTTGTAFTVSRNLAAGSTDSPIMTVDQNSSTDDQPALKVTGGIADVAGGVTVLDVLTTSAGMASGGDIAIGVTSTVATNAADAASTYLYAFNADLDAAGGGSATNYGYYAGSGFDYGINSLSPGWIQDQLSVDDNSGAQALRVGQQGAGAIAVFRDGTAAAGSNRYLFGSDGDFTHTPANPTGAFTGHTQTLTSGGLGAVTAKGQLISIVGAAGDVGSTLYGLELAYTDNGGGYAAGGRRGVNIDANWDWGIYCASPSYFNDQLRADGNILLIDDATINLGNSSDAVFLYSASQTPDSLVLALSTQSRALIVTENGDHTTDFAHALQTNPTIFIQSADATDVGEFVGLSYNGLLAGQMATDQVPPDFTIKSFAAASGGANDDGGNLVLEGGDKDGAGNDGVVQIGSSFSTGHSLVAKEDLGVAGKLEVNGNAYFDSTFFIADNQQLVFGNSSDTSFRWSTVQTNDSLGLHLGTTSKTLFVTDIANISKDHDHANQSDPTIFVHSVLDPDTDNSEYVGFTYDGLQCGAMETDRAVFNFTIKAVDAAAAAAVNINGGHVVFTPGDAVGAGVDGLVRSTNCFYVTDGVGAPTVPTVIRVPLMVDSDPSAGLPTAAFFNVGSSASSLLLLSQGDIENGGTATNRLIVGVDGQTTIAADNSSDAFSVTQDDTGGGTARIVRLTDGDNSIVRLDLYQNGQLLLETDVADSGLKVTQDNGTTTPIFECAEGTQAAHTARFQVLKHGAVTIEPAAPTANFDAIDATFTSGVLDNETAKGLDINITTNAGDVNTANYYGVDLNMTDAGGSSVTIAIEGTSDWDRAFQFDTDPADNEHSAIICNAGSNASYLFLLGEGTVASNTPRFRVTHYGETEIFADDTGTALYVEQDGAGGNILQLVDTSTPVLTVSADGGAVDIDVTDNTNGVRIGNAGTTTNLLELIDGTVAAGTQRFLFYDTGKALVTTDSALADVAVELNQQDADQPFMYFNGTASDPAAGSAPADNITEINGSGAVVGPQTTSGSPDTGWTFNGMFKTKVDAVGGGTVDVWIATYAVATS